MAAKPSCYLLPLVMLALFLGFLSPPAVADQALAPTSTLFTGQSLDVGAYRLTMQSDCNLVLYDNGRYAWSTNTNGRGTNCRLTMQRDGNLVLYNGAGNAVWASNTARANGNYVLLLQRDRNIVIYGGSIWSSGTRPAVSGEEGATVAPAEKVVINTP